MPKEKVKRFKSLKAKKLEDLTVDEFKSIERQQKHRCYRCYKKAKLYLAFDAGTAVGVCKRCK